MLEDYLLFFSEIRDNFTSMGAIAPSSSLLAKAIVRPLTERPSRPISVLEVGPGTGSFTCRILDQLRAGDTLDIYEVNPKFCGFLKEVLERAELSERAIHWELHNADIRTLRNTAQFDYIIFGLPFSNFDVQTVAEILEILVGHLSPAGVLSYFEYVLLREFKIRLSKNADRDRLVRVAKAVRSFNQKYQYRCNHVWWNLPPAKARHCRKHAEPLEKSQSDSRLRQ